MESLESNVEVEKGFLFKRKDFLGVDQMANSHPNRTYYYRKHFDLDEVIMTCSKKLQVLVQMFLLHIFYKPNYNQ